MPYIVCIVVPQYKFFYLKDMFINILFTGKLCKPMNRLKDYSPLLCFHLRRDIFARNFRSP